MAIRTVIHKGQIASKYPRLFIGISIMAWLVYKIISGAM